MKIERTTFKNNRGNTLSARFDIPENSRGTALFAHCFTCTKNTLAVRRIIAGLNEQQISVLSFDFTGLGDSEGEFSESFFSNQLADIIAAANFLEKEYNQPPKILVGHSLGGTACLYASRAMESVTGVVTIGSPFEPEHVTHLFAPQIQHASDEKELIDVSIGGRPFQINQKFIEDFKKHPPSAYLSELKKDVLILHSPIDEVVGVENAEQIFKFVKHPKSYVSLDQANHMLTAQQDAEFAASVISGWSTRHFQPISKPTEQNTFIKTKHQVVTQIKEQPFLTQINFNNKHVIVCDEPVSFGGTDTGPTPIEMLLGALGSCTVMTLQIYANKKGIPLKGARTHLDYDGSSNKPIITRYIEFDGTLTSEQEKSLLKIAEKCPVHKILESGTSMTTKKLL